MIIRLLLSAVTITVYFFLSLPFPILGYLIPYYRMVKIGQYGRKYTLTVHILVVFILLILGRFSSTSQDLVAIYLLFPYLSEFLFYLFNNLGRRKLFWASMKLYDRIVLTSLIMSSLAFIYFYLNRYRIASSIDEVLNMIKSNDQISMNVVEMFNNLVLAKDMLIYLLFKYAFLTNLFLFLALIPTTYRKWRISWYWLLPFMLIILIKRFTNIELNLFFTTNILLVVGYIYGWYGIKNIYGIMDSFGVRSNILKHGISIILGLYFPTATFILGAVASFEVIEFKEIRI